MATQTLERGWYRQQISQRRQLTNRLCIELYLAAKETEDVSRMDRIMTGLEKAIACLEETQQDAVEQGARGSWS